MSVAPFKAKTKAEPISGEADGIGDGTFWKEIVIFQRKQKL